MKVKIDSKCSMIKVVQKELSKQENKNNYNNPSSPKLKHHQVYVHYVNHLCRNE